jgi:DNA-binding CsgD family transcriptional regulator
MADSTSGSVEGSEVEGGAAGPARGKRGLGGWRLTPAETAVVALAIEGYSNDEIGRVRGCSGRTVANQLAAVYAKMGVSGRRALRAFVRRGD